ncbi:UDP-N-acetylmuramoyl-L-alanyl-D-glutamate--2,6-diaminopimelate ligase [Clostridium estertheticum]|uniref:UDP-N-acetylmuramoyl-L-alanyl-D-glutamate--2, 6-diaminopimelate ligase n=1 Tax=Clostridium estertheticum TaxID=238834 RepID=UPI00124C4747|nr:UDP-N-acetylmuramoyl-L-alanyl-D-glutamate--2,6-diaminopimelate ligase [Clostridium estertheticum]MBU3074123.1 UDP-N-acetylmuramoyl-L-alanyl-D-glutamate--2,6-diaminopimelate ligase [Clostridium estertheticum]MBU3164217.1 UDP-N-acetylmuramoyl-L-alanyl-D-glutamate--2,6-diaminopimelate ligase [Clostridium estertheticum]MBU3170152.1 UDP-N-acetylmuramoyl-L-alanyl-D-glutamate--2,6-diaminopimelate ligase [Clostridium estertheticum]MBZ9617070.1 UDP-N-acetylmuramoyl-L-alanyl-D-glutamate--2,6-diaminopi
MKLRKIMENINFNLIKGDIDIDIKKIQYDSRKVKKGDVFFAIEGYNLDGHKYIQSAINNGAVAVVCQKDIEDGLDIVVIKVEDARRTLAISAANFYENPSRSMKMIGITGTNGKTTSAFMIKAILEQSGYKVGLIGTIANFIGKKKIHTERTTPESLELHELFKEMVDSNVDYCVMEVSSHSLSLDRVYGIEFCESIFTNLTQDHLDFHKTFENYFNAKLKLFKLSKTSVINIDDEYGAKAYNSIKNSKLSFALNHTADIMASNIKMHSRGSKFTLKYKESSFDIELNIPGNYNVYNALGCITVCLNQGIEITVIKKALQKVQVPGRCELVENNQNLGFEIILDYAHTPDGLENILETVREFTKGKLISVYGCGGDRDKTKRPIMGKIGTNLSDFSFITSDNPRTEDPLEIIKDVVLGIEKNNFEIIENRREAIKRAIESATTGDIIVIAGKGHEDYQILKDKTIHFDEREVISEILKEKL